MVGSLSNRLTDGTYEALMVVNPFRPGTGSPEQVAQYAQWLERVARIRFTGLVNNANLGPLTRAEDVLTGLEQVQTAARLLNLPVRFTAVSTALASALPGLDLLPLQLRMRPPWELSPATP